MLNISNGIRRRAVKVVVTGSEGIGKSTLASKAPGALFVDTEGGTDQLDIKRIVGIDSWEKLLKVPSEVIATPGCCRTLVIDTADWAEAMCIGYICRKFKVNGLESFGYGKGYTYLFEEFNSLLKELDKLIAADINVIVIAHAKLRKQELPDEQGAFDRWEMKLTRQVAPLLKEWADAVLFCNYKTFVTTTDTGVHKAAGGERVIYTTHHACWDAKNRFGLPEEVPLDYKSISRIFLDKTPEPTTQETTSPTLQELMERDGVTEEQLQKIVARKGVYQEETPVSEYSSEFVTTWILPNWEKICGLLSKNSPSRG